MVTCEAETARAVDGRSMAERFTSTVAVAGAAATVRPAMYSRDAGLGGARRRVGQHGHARALARGVGQDLPGLVRAAELEDAHRDEQQHRDRDRRFEQRGAAFGFAALSWSASSLHQERRGDGADRQCRSIREPAGAGRPVDLLSSSPSARATSRAVRETRRAEASPLDACADGEQARPRSRCRETPSRRLRVRAACRARRAASRRLRRCRRAGAPAASARTQARRPTRAPAIEWPVSPRPASARPADGHRCRQRVRNPSGPQVDGRCGAGGRHDGGQHDRVRCWKRQ